MIITHGTKKQELRYLSDLFKKLFENKVDDVLETRIHGKLSLYMYHCDDQDLLENFVKEYFIMRSQIINLSDSAIGYIKSTEFKDESLLNKIKIKHKSRQLQKLCENINKFEKEFFERTGISLLRVENDRCCNEQKAKREQEVQ